MELHYDTWGSYGQFSKSVAILRSGAVVDPERLARQVYRGQTKRVRVGDVEVLVVDRSSRKNRHVRVYVPRDAVLAVVRIRRSASKLKEPELLEGEGRIEEAEEVREEETGRYRVRRTYRVWYYAGPGGVRVPLHSVQVGYERELTGRPWVRISYHPGASLVIVTGDTYYVRDVLKSHGLRWDPGLRHWYTHAGPELARRLARELEERAGAEVELSLPEWLERERRAAEA